MRVLENGVASRCEQSSSCHPGQKFRVKKLCRSRRLGCILFFGRRGGGPKVYIVAIWTKPNTRSGGKARETVEAFSVLLLPVVLKSTLSFACRWIIRIGFCFNVFFFSIVEVLVEGMAFSLVGIERDGKSTRLQTHVRRFRRHSSGDRHTELTW